MAAELDEMFTALGAQADALPIGSARAARHRGERRTRTRLTVAAAVAVCAVTGGAAVALRPEPDPLPPAAPTGVLQLGSAQEYGTEARRTMSAVSGQSVYTGWQGEDGEVGVAGTDLHTGRVRWQDRSFGRFDEFIGVIALPRAVLVSVAEEDGNTLVRRMEVLDPATGAKRWDLPYRVADDLVHYDDLLVMQTAATGETRAYDWATGAVRWSRPADADPVRRTLGMSVPADERRAGPSGLPLDFSDRRLVQITRSGRVQIRDAGTGELTDSRAAGAPQRNMVAFDGRLFNAENTEGAGRYRIRVTALDGGPDARVVRTGTDGLRFDAMAPCGDGRLCVAESDATGAAWLTASDVAGGTQRWRVPTVANPVSIQAAGGAVLVAGPGEQALHDAQGRELARTDGRLGWDGDRSVLSLPARSGPDIARVAPGDGTRRLVGRMPVTSAACVWSADRLACPGRAGLTLWTLPA